MKKLGFCLFPFFFSMCLLAEVNITVKEKVVNDYKNFYTASHGLYYFSSLAVAGIFANTRADEKIDSFYQKKIRSPATDLLSSYVKPFGNRGTMLGFFGAFFVLQALEKVSKRSFPLIFVEKISRMLLVGVPPLLMTQSVLGGTRPLVKEPHSHWKPFQNNFSVSASGHSFFGALPFLALASMTDSFFLRLLCMAASSFTAFSRLNDHKHYFSQILLGWSLAYLSFDTISSFDSSLRFRVKATENELALGFSYRFP